MSTDIDIKVPSGLWDVDKFPLVIAGPCSAESEGQMMRTAKQLKRIPEVKVFRAGIWEPRTRPGEFEGFGEMALSWLEKVKMETGLKTTIQVAKPKHVELALKYGVDML